MSTKPLTESLTQITRFGFVNAFLVREDDGFTLVDTAIRSADALLAAARQGGAPIRRILLTHGHGDHVGSLDQLHAQLGPTVQVLMPEVDAQIHAGEYAADGTGKLAGGWPKITTTPDVRLAPGDRIGSLEAIATPGHTPGHMSFTDTRDGTLIAGDVYTSVGGIRTTSAPNWRFPLAVMATNDRAQNLESAKVLRALEPPLMVVGHGPVTHAPAAAMDRAIARGAH